VDIGRDGGMRSEMKHRLSEGDKVSSVLGKMYKGEGLAILKSAKRAEYSVKSRKFLFLNRACGINIYK
jgi:hypothetical protein